MRKLYTKLLTLLACVVSTGAFAQVTNVAVDDASPCAGASVTVSWDFGSGGGGPYSIQVSKIAFGQSDITSGTQPSNNFIFSPLNAGDTIYVTVAGQDNVVVNAPIIYVDSATVTPTGFTINGLADTNVCAGVDFTLDVTGGSAGTSGVLTWYDDALFTNNLGTGPLTVVGGIPGPSEDYFARYEGFCDSSAVFQVVVYTFIPASLAATNVALDGVAYAGPVCAGTYLLTALGGDGGNNPATDTLYFSEGTFTIPLSNPLTIPQASSQDVYIQYVDGCTGTTYNSGLIGPIVTNTASVDGAMLNASPNDSVCLGVLVNVSTDVTEVVGTNATYEYSFNGITWTATAAGGTTNSVNVLITKDTTVYIRLISACDTTPGLNLPIKLLVASTVMDSVRSDVNQVCSGDNAEFTSFGGVLSSGGRYEYSINGGAWVDNMTADSIILPITVTTVVYFRIVDSCGTYGPVLSNSVTVATANVEPTSLVVSMDTVCSGASVSFKALGGTLSNYTATPAVYQFSTTNFADTLQSSTVDSIVFIAPAGQTVMYSRIAGGCAPSGTIVTDTVFGRTTSVAPTTLTVTDAFAVNVTEFSEICPQMVTLTADGSIGDDSAVYDFGYITGGVFTSFGAPQTSSIYGPISFSVDTIYAVRMDSSICFGTSDTVAFKLGLAEDNVAATSLVITSGVDTVADLSEICAYGTLSYSLVGGTLGDNASYEFSVQVDALTPVTYNTGTNNTLTFNLDTINPSDSIVVYGYIVGGCTDISAVIDSAKLFLLPAIDLTVNNYSDLTCFYSTDGAIENIFASGGSAPYLYSFDGQPFSSTTSFTGLSAAVHEIRVQDNNGCVAPFYFTLGVPDTIKADIVLVTFSAVDGWDIKITRTGGTGTLQAKINNGVYSIGDDFFNLQPGTYTYTVLDDNGCTITNEFTLYDPSSVGSTNTGVEFSVYPNPFAGTLTVVGQIPSDVSFTLIDAYGKVVGVNVVRNGDNAIINTDELAKGMYILNITGNGVNVSKKVIKN